MYFAPYNQNFLDFVQFFLGFSRSLGFGCKKQKYHIECTYYMMTHKNCCIHRILIFFPKKFQTSTATFSGDFIVW